MSWCDNLYRPANNTAWNCPWWVGFHRKQAVARTYYHTDKKCLISDITFITFYHHHLSDCKTISRLFNQSKPVWSCPFPTVHGFKCLLWAVSQSDCKSEEKRLNVKKRAKSISNSSIYEHLSSCFIFHWSGWWKAVSGERREGEDDEKGGRRNRWTDGLVLCFTGLQPGQDSSLPPRRHQSAG